MLYICHHSKEKHEKSSKISIPEQASLINTTHTFTLKLTSISINLHFSIHIHIGCSYDDHSRFDICRLLATTKCLFHRHILLSIGNNIPIYSGNLSWHLLACDEQFNVQSNYILHIFRQVSVLYSIFIYIYSICIFFYPLVVIIHFSTLEICLYCGFFCFSVLLHFDFVTSLWGMFCVHFSFYSIE